MTNNTATPKPWYIVKHGGIIHIQSSAINEDNYVTGIEERHPIDEANAEHIVKCCNNYDIMVELFKQILNDGGLNDTTKERIREIISKN